MGALFRALHLSQEMCKALPSKTNQYENISRELKTISPLPFEEAADSDHKPHRISGWYWDSFPAFPCVAHRHKIHHHRHECDLPHDGAHGDAHTARQARSQGPEAKFRHRFAVAVNSLFVLRK